MMTLLLVAAFAAKAEVPKTLLPEPAAAAAAVVRTQVLPEPSAAQAAATGECRLGGAALVPAAEPRKTGAMPEPKSDDACSLIGIYAKRRMLSGPWSASRRLKAARIRGDEGEAKRMEAMLGDLLGKAITDESEGSVK